VNVVRVEICIDCADPARLNAFWQHVLGYVQDPAEIRQLLDPAGSGPSLWFQRVPEPKTVKNRVHIDGYVADRDAAVRRRDELVALGGVAVAEFDTFIVMGDPEGNEFCLCWE
jgi:hypothetical protein